MPNPDTNRNQICDFATRKAPEHLNSSGCRIQVSNEKGRGVYASKSIPIGTVIEISPVLLFTKQEYDEYGRHTVLDNYTFKWKDGRMALALGLGSLFNHSESPNVSYTLDPFTESIRYTTTKYIHSEDELCIFYGHRLWFDPVASVRPQPSEETEDGWGGLSSVADNIGVDQPECPSFLDGNPDEIVSDEDLPFARVKVSQDEDEEEELSAVRTLNAWVVDIPDPRDITKILKWLKMSGLESSELSHLKRIRNKEGASSLLLCSSSNALPLLPDDFKLPHPYTVPVPLTAGLTVTSAQLKSSLWPTIYAPRRKNEIEAWSKRKVRWAWESMKRVVATTSKAKAEGELPIVAYVPAPFEDGDQLSISFVAHDTRHATAHPLRHAVLNVIRRIADYRALVPIADNVEVTEIPPSSKLAKEQVTQNGSHYLTSLTLFTTHEPCIMCSMALLHSRVKEVFYLIPMEKTGGCGGSTCLPKLDGVNHRFGISRWAQEGVCAFDLADLTLQEVIDA